MDPKTEPGEWTAKVGAFGWAIVDDRNITLAWVSKKQPAELIVHRHNQDLAVLHEELKDRKELHDVNISLRTTQADAHNSELAALREELKQANRKLREADESIQSSANVVSSMATEIGDLKRAAHQPQWIRTADRPPTEQDADQHGMVIGMDDAGFVIGGRWELFGLPYWLPIPPVTSE